VYRYAQTHSNAVTGFVAMNPVPPYTSWLEQAAKVETPEELQSIEVEFFKGANDERVDLRDTDLMVDEPTTDDLHYVIMFAEDCPGDFCDRIRPVLAAATNALANLGAGGTYVAVPGAGHEIFATDLATVREQILQLLH
jgi:pimeloyl-ACP methyl ester carboxylesterase